MGSAVGVLKRFCLILINLLLRTPFNGCVYHFLSGVLLKGHICQISET